MNDKHAHEQAELMAATGAEIYEMIRNSGLTIEGGFFALTMAIYEVGKALGADPREKFIESMNRTFQIKDSQNTKQTKP